MLNIAQDQYWSHHHQGRAVLKRPNKPTEARPIPSVCLALLICSALTAASLANHQAAAAAAAATAPAPLTKDARWSLSEDSWNYWWSYSGVSGPAYWGLLNLDWALCDKGRRQSPINIETGALVYDPHLRPLRILDNNLLSGVLYNDGHAIVFHGSAAAAEAAAATTKQPDPTSDSAPPPPLPDGNNEINESDKQMFNNSGGGGGGADGKTVVRQATSASDRANGLASLADFTMDEPGFNGDEPKVQMLVRSSELSDEMNLNIEQGRPASSGGEQEARRDGFQVASALQSQPQSSLLSDEEPAETGAGTAAAQSVQFEGAGLAYSYRFEMLQLKFGQAASGGAGSEHQINKRSFAAELQLLAYNSHLYESYQEALTRPYGLLGVGILIDTLPPGEQQHQQQHTPNEPRPNEQLERLVAQATSSLVHRGQFVALDQFNLTSLLPETEQFVSYEGSLTQPGCHESVTWLLLNRPLYIIKQSLDNLRSLKADEQSAPSSSGTPLAGNTRPVQALNYRPIRTNIQPPSEAAGPNQEPAATCPRLWTRYDYAQTKARR